jgi:deoxycytidylate deaminase
MTDEYCAAVKAGGHGDGSTRAALHAVVFDHGHEAVWSQELLAAMLGAVGFKTRRCECGQSEHAELNAITNAARVGTPLDGCTLVVTHPPCMDCARAIVQAGIKQVFVPSWDALFHSRWHEHISRSRKLFEECGVEYFVLPEAER